MSGVNGTLALSSLVASLDRETLLGLVRRRKIASPDSVEDPIDLASELLRVDSIAQALAELPRATLAALIGLADSRGGSEPSPATELAALRALGLVGVQPDGSVVSLPEVSAQLLTQLASRDVTPADLHASPPTVPARMVDVDTSGWFTAALTAVGQVAWLLRALSRSPVRLNRNGAVPSAWVKSIHEDLGIAEASELVWLIGEAGLTETYAGMLTTTGDTWLRSTHTERWLVLAQAAERLQPSPMWRLFDRFEEPGGRLPTGLSVAEVAAQLPHEFPLVTDATVKTTTRALDLWERLGITVGGHLSEFGATLRLRDTPGHPAVPKPVFPSPTSGVYVQPDLSVVVPGLLSPADEADLATIAVPEQIGVASTLRISDASLGEAFDRGRSYDEIRSTIARLSLTGIPQPLDYLLSSLATRAGSIRVSAHDGDEGRTRIDFDRADMRSTVLVDRSLAHLHLREAGNGAASKAASIGSPRPVFSRLRADHVLAALLDSRYPAVASQATRISGLSVTASMNTRADAAAAEHRRDPLVELVDRVLDAAKRGPSDLGRQVTLAIRDKTMLNVTVEMRGHTRDFTILPVSLSAGRVRALDEAAGVERTLPLDAITRITQAPSTA